MAALPHSLRRHCVVVHCVVRGARPRALRRSGPLSGPAVRCGGPLVAYALAGNMNVDITKDALGQDADGNDVF
ncbi:hypothetical protein AB0E96_32450, partial [Kitasatospora sp. NPDC036755]|uniref:hypothetical protein n=1 Tax=Kitasatospora sp. NPDC036755 TaxID=3154600 RepID=UPI0033F8F38A